LDLGLNQRETEVVSGFLSKIANNIENDKGKITRDRLILLLENYMLDNALLNKNRILNVDE